MLTFDSLANLTEGIQWKVGYTLKPVALEHLPLGSIVSVQTGDGFTRRTLYYGKAKVRGKRWVPLKYLTLAHGKWTTERRSDALFSDKEILKDADSVGLQVVGSEVGGLITEPAVLDVLPDKSVIGMEKSPVTGDTISRKVKGKWYTIWRDKKNKQYIEKTKKDLASLGEKFDPNQGFESYHLSGRIGYLHYYGTKSPKRSNVKREDEGASLFDTLLESKPKATGDCYEAAFNWLFENVLFPFGAPLKDEADRIFLVHGEVAGQGPLEGLRYGHAWIEHGDTVIDQSNGGNRRLPKSVYYSMGRIVPEFPPFKPNIHRYTPEQARKKVLKHKHYGPWDLKTASGL
jgi:hypothetical protein